MIHKGARELPLLLSTAGWPLPLPGMNVEFAESGPLGWSYTPRIVAWLHGQHVLSAEIDSRLGVTRVQRIPASALTTQEAFQNWIWDEIASSRQLLYPPTGAWWIVEDQDWEVVLACGPPDLRDGLEPLDDDRLFDWLPMAWMVGERKSEARHVAKLYHLPWSNGHE